MTTPILSLVLLLLSPLSAHAFGSGPARNESTRAAMKEMYEVVKQHELDGRLELPGGCRLQAQNSVSLAESQDSRGQLLFVNMEQPRHSSSFNMHEQYSCQRESNGYYVAFACHYDMSYCEDNISCRNPRKVRATFDFRYVPAHSPGGRAEIVAIQNCK